MSDADSARPTRAELEAARDRLVPDVLAPNLSVLFCGINPGLYSGWMGHHFARPGNRFWKALHQSGFSDRLLHPREDGLLPLFGCGLTNLVSRATARADELAAEELRAGRQRLERGRPWTWQPRLAVLGGGSPHRLRSAPGRPGAASRPTCRRPALGAPQPQRAERPLQPG
ncbi:MAG: mismatch-specific DNA-glycosylase [Caldilineales bacterium]|nr:mismatch-specific DNA-glycosylase [Caldilineales bacterium]